MFFEDPFKEERKQDGYYSKSHEYEDTERDYLDLRIDDPGISNPCRYNGEKDSCRQIRDSEQQRVLYCLFYCLIEPSDERECIRCRRKDRKKEEDGRVHGPLVVLGESGPDHIDLEKEECREYAIDNPETG